MLKRFDDNENPHDVAATSDGRVFLITSAGARCLDGRLYEFNTATQELSMLYTGLAYPNAIDVVHLAPEYPGDDQVAIYITEAAGCSTSYGTSRLNAHQTCRLITCVLFRWSLQGDEDCGRRLYIGRCSYKTVGDKGLV